MDSNTKTFTGVTGETNAFDGYKGLRIGQQYRGTAQEENILVAPVGAPAGSGVLVSTLEWEKWFQR